MTGATTTVAIAWPAISSAGGTGVARRRLSTPVSRSVGDRDDEVGVGGGDDRHREDARDVEARQIDAHAVDDGVPLPNTPVKTTSRTIGKKKVKKRARGLRMLASRS